MNFVCPGCGRRYGGAGYCPADGHRLQAAGDPLQGERTPSALAEAFVSTRPVPAVAIVERRGRVGIMVGATVVAVIAVAIALLVVTHSGVDNGSQAPAGPAPLAAAPASPAGSAPSTNAPSTAPASGSQSPASPGVPVPASKPPAGRGSGAPAHQPGSAAPAPGRPADPGPTLVDGSRPADHGVIIGENVRMGEHILIGGVPVGPPPTPPPPGEQLTRPADYKARQFDPVAYLPKAERLARELLPDAKLTSFGFDPVFADGHVDLTMDGGDRSYEFRSPERSALPAGRPPIDRKCRVTVELGATSISARVRTSDSCDTRFVRAPTCSFASVWKQALAGGARGDLVARIAWFDDGWFFDLDFAGKGGGVSSFADRCP